MMTSIHLRKPPYPQYPNVPRGILHATKKKKRTTAGSPGGSPLVVAAVHILVMDMFYPLVN